SILAVVAGIIVLTAVSFAIEAVVPASNWFMWVYGMLSVVLGGYVTARLAPSVPLKHAIAMGALQAALTALSYFAPDHKVSVQQCILIAVVSFIAAVAGGFLFAVRKK